MSDKSSIPPPQRRPCPRPRPLCRLRGLSPGALALLALAGGLALLSPRGASGDILILKNGKRWEGKVSPGSDPETVRIAVGDGTTLEFKREDVLEIKEAPSRLELFDKRFKALRADREADLEAYEELARWAWRRELQSRALEVFRAIIADLDPNHQEARRALGYVVFRNRWVLEKTLKKKGEWIKVDGEWMTPEEHERRRLADLRRRVASDFEGIDSENKQIQAYSFRELKNRCRDPRMREVLLEFLDHQSEAVRLVAVELLGLAFEKAKSSKTAVRSVRAEKDAAKADGPRSPEFERELDRRIARALLDRALGERSELVRKLLAKVLVQLRQRAFFELALRTATTSKDERSRDRAAEGALYALRKAWVGELFEALQKPPPGVGEAGNPSLRRILLRIFKQDFAYDAKKWQRWWRLNSRRYEDDEGED